MSSQWIVGLGRVEPGDRIEVWDLQYLQYLRYLGTVSEVAPELGVLWIVDAATGTRKLIQADEFRLCRVPVAQPA